MQKEDPKETVYIEELRQNQVVLHFENFQSIIPDSILFFGTTLLKETVTFIIPKEWALDCPTSAMIQQIDREDFLAFYK